MKKRGLVMAEYGEWEKHDDGLIQARFSFWNSSRICRDVSVSRFAHRSSANRIRGLLTSAWAIETLCCCPRIVRRTCDLAGLRCRRRSGSLYLPVRILL